MPGEVGNEPLPELRRTGVEHHRAFVVEAVQAQRLPHAGIVRAVPDRARDIPAVRADPLGRIAARAAGPDLAVLLPAGVDRPETGRGEGGKDAGVLGYRVRH